MKILVVSPHPDDSEIGLGASIYDWVCNGNDVTIAVCTGTGDLKMAHSGAVIQFETRIAEQREAARLLGATVNFLNIAPASRFDTVPIVEFVSKFDKAFKEFDVVYLPLPSQAMDHEVTWKAGLAAFRQGKLDNVALYAYEHPMQYFGCGVDRVLGRTYMPVSDMAVKVKLQSIAAHASQFATRPDPGLYSPRALKAFMAGMGSECGHQNAELSYLVRRVA